MHVVGLDNQVAHCYIADGHDNCSKIMACASSGFHMSQDAEPDCEQPSQGLDGLCIDHQPAQICFWLPGSEMKYSIA